MDNAKGKKRTEMVERLKAVSEVWRTLDKNAIRANDERGNKTQVPF